MDPNTLSWARDWQTALAGVVVALLMGFRWWFSYKRERREDQAGDTTHESYQAAITMLREENERIWKIAEVRQKQIDQLEKDLHQLGERCKERGFPVRTKPREDTTED